MRRMSDEMHEQCCDTPGCRRMPANCFVGYGTTRTKCTKTYIENMASEAARGAAEGNRKPFVNREQVG
jgi:hypothetical protein